MKNIQKMVEELHLDNQITLEDIPQVDLYMDQVIQLFEKKYNNSIRNDAEKVLTKTMINNYAKGKLLIPIKNKKYTKEHLILIGLIYQLKGGLSIQDIKVTLQNLNDGITDSTVDLDRFYNSYLNITKKNAASFLNEVQGKVDRLTEESNDFEGENKVCLEQILLITSLINMSNMYRRMAEKFIDEILIK